MNIIEAIEQGKTEIVKTILRKDPWKIEPKNDTDRCPLSYAIAYERLDIAKVLIDKGASLEWVDITGRSPLEQYIWLEDNGKIKGSDEMFYLLNPAEQEKMRREIYFDRLLGGEKITAKEYSRKDLESYILHLLDWDNCD